MKIKTCIIIIIIISAMHSFANDFNIKDFGAIGNGQSINTIFIQKAIDSAFKNGGGRIIIPAGIFLTGSVHLKNNVEIFLEKGAVFLGSSHLSDYERNHRWYAIILAEDRRFKL